MWQTEKANMNCDRVYYWIRRFLPGKYQKLCEKFRKSLFAIHFAQNDFSILLKNKHFPDFNIFRIKLFSYEEILIEKDGADCDTHTFDVSYNISDSNVDVRKCIDESVDRKRANIFDKFRLLMWKNFLLQYRHKAQTIIQILIPILFTVNLLFVRSLVKPEFNSQNTHFNPISINTIRQL